jgi:hypothetical protein
MHSKADGGNSQTHRQHGDRIRLLSFFQNKESRLKKPVGQQVRKFPAFYGTQRSITNFARTS